VSVCKLIGEIITGKALRFSVDSVITCGFLKSVTVLVDAFENF
jgi:hypothetical protein